MTLWEMIEYKVDTTDNCYRPQTKLREGYVFTPVCQSFCSRGGGDVRDRGGWGMCGGACVAEGECVVWGACMQDTRSLKRAVRILLECILVFLTFPSKWMTSAKSSATDIAFLFASYPHKLTLIICLRCYKEKIHKDTFTKKAGFNEDTR